MRFSGAYPWTILNQRTGTANISSGKLNLFCAATSQNMDPILVVQAMDSGDGAWRAQTDMTTISNADYQGLGLALRESSTGKMLLFGYANNTGVKNQVRRMPATGGTTDFNTWSANYGSTGANDFTGYLEIIRDGSTLYFLTSEDESNWTELVRVAQTVDFTTAPNQVGLWTNTAVSFGNTRTGIFEKFEKVERTVPYNVPLVNPGAELGVTGYTNVTGTLGTRNIAHSGSNGFKITGNPGPFEVYQEWSAVLFASLIDAGGGGGVTATLAGWGRPWEGATSSFRLRLNAYDSGGSSLGSNATAYWSPSTTYSQKSTSLALPSGTRKLRVTFEGTTAASDDCWLDDLTLSLA